MWYLSSLTRDRTHTPALESKVLTNGPVAAAAAKSLQSCPTLCHPIDGSPPGSPVPGILQARTLEWVAISFSNAWEWKVKVKSRSRIRLLATPWTAAHQAPPLMGFSRQEYWSGVLLPSLNGPVEKSAKLNLKNWNKTIFKATITNKWMNKMWPRSYKPEGNVIKGATLQ